MRDIFEIIRNLRQNEAHLPNRATKTRVPCRIRASLTLVRLHPG